MSLPDIPPVPQVSACGHRPIETELCNDAAQIGDLVQVRKLVQQVLHSDGSSYGNLQPRPEWFRSSVATAIEQHELNIVEYLVHENVVTPDDQYFVELAVRCQTFDILELFLQRGWDINKPLHRNQPPVLWIPLCDGQKQMVKWLLDHGADPNARCAWNYTPASQAMLCAPLDLIDYMFSRGADVAYGELLQWAVIRDRPDALEVVKRVVERGAPINKLKYEDEPAVFLERKIFGLGTPLHRAAEDGKADVVRYLLEQGADPLKLDSKGHTARYWADLNGHPSVGIQLIHAEDQWFPRLQRRDSSLDMHGTITTVYEDMVYR
ncbi:ankyrin [Pseudovirgaria hyperparasitica]|uniref:Ankyrin n=1 Tax=Pseudovirgaria hyperparasitica TaxID=470096 RepID=A0A6A6W326_9PEZI|nr:ankyrin [Pseudovirgaria hyperparasitica]KAF2756386.1 ankyrin [Pseudovirgaria hyperparasitica]